MEFGYPVEDVISGVSWKLGYFIESARDDCGQLETIA